MRIRILIIFFILAIVLPLISAAHYIVGIVNDARDGTLADGHEIVLWNPANGIDDNLTDIIGPSGNSGENNIYMIDCELLSSPCDIGDEIRAKVINNGDNYITGNVSVNVTGAGYDVAPNLSLNSPPNVTSIIVDDSIEVPLNEIDLIAASNRSVFCRANIYEFDGDGLQNATAEFFDNSVSYYG